MRKLRKRSRDLIATFPFFALSLFGASSCAKSGDPEMALPAHWSARVESPSTRFLEYRFKIPGLNPSGLGVLDSRHHGQDDIVVANSGSSDVAMFFNRGNGSFSSQGVIKSCSGGDEVDGEDITGDGNDDFIVSCGGFSMLSLFVGDGQGHFSRQDIPVGASPIQAQTAPYVRGAGTPYIAVLHDSPASLELLYRERENHFSRARELPVPAQPTQFAADIFTRDGSISYAVTSALNSKLSVYVNRGGEYFRTDYSAPESPGQVSAIDLRGNGYSDLVVTSGTVGKFRVYFNDGDGSFRRFEDYDLPAGPASSIGTTHFRGQPQSEIAFQSGVSGDIVFYPVMGGGRLGSPEVIRLGSTYTGLITGHFAHTSDGMDIALIDSQKSELVVLLNQRVNFN